MSLHNPREDATGGRTFRVPGSRLNPGIASEFARLGRRFRGRRTAKPRIRGFETGLGREFRTGKELEKATQRLIRETPRPGAPAAPTPVTRQARLAATAKKVDKTRKARSAKSPANLFSNLRFRRKRK